MFFSYEMLHLLIIPHVQTQSNQVCKLHVILLFLMLQSDHHLPDNKNIFNYDS
jgi:hypothetical protein